MPNKEAISTQSAGSPPVVDAAPGPQAAVAEPSATGEPGATDGHVASADRAPRDPQAPRRSKARIIADVTIIAVFLAVIGLPVLDMLFGFDATPSSENREPAPTPKAIRALSAEGTWSQRFSQAKQRAGDLPRESKEWIGDHFGFRNLMIHLHGEVKLNLLGVSSTPHVLLGKHEFDDAGNALGRWLYYNRYHVVDHYRAADLFTDAELEQWRLVLEERRDWLKQRGAHYLVVIASNKHTIYPEFLPDAINRVGERSRTDQLVEYLRAHSDIDVIDTRPTLERIKAEHPDRRLFHRTDTHWNGVGGFYAYQAITERLADMFPAITPLTWDQFTLRDVRGEPGDLARMLAVPEQFSETHLLLDPNPPLPVIIDRGSEERHTLRTENPAAAGPRLLMFRDSFGVALMPYLAQHFKHAVFTATDQFDYRAVEKEKPDVVISEMVERLLMRDPPALRNSN